MGQEVVDGQANEGNVLTHDPVAYHRVGRVGGIDAGDRPAVPAEESAGMV